MRESPRSRLVAYGASLPLVALSLLLRWRFNSVLGDRALYSTCLPAVMIAAYFGGFSAGLAVTLVATLATNFFIVEPRFVLRLKGAGDDVAMVLFVMSGAIISGLSESLHRARHRIVADERRRAEEELTETRERFRGLVQNSSDIISLFDAQGRVLYQAPSVERLLGHSADERIGRNVFRDPIVHPDDSGAKRAFFDTMLSRPGAPVTAEFRLRHADGSWRDIEAVGQNFLHDSSVAGIVANYRDITERKRAEDAMRRLAELLRLSDDAVVVWRLDGGIESWSRGAEALYGFAEAEALGRGTHELLRTVHPVPWPEIEAKLRAGGSWEGELHHRTKDGREVIVSTRQQLVRDEDGVWRVLESNRDITERKRDQALLDGQKRILELIIQGEPLADVLAFLCRTIEELTTEAEMLASVLLLDADGIHVRHGAAPNLPESYIRAIDGLAIGPAAGSCGTAAYRREPVYVSDIASDPLWAPYAEMALSHDLRACWSSPILSSTGAVLGTFAMYYRQPRRPTPRDLRVVDIVTRTVAIAIERSHAERALRESEERFRRLAKATNDAVWDWDLVTNKVWWNEGVFTLFGYVLEQIEADPAWWLERVHPDDRAAVETFFYAVVHGREQTWVDEYRFRCADGSYKDVYDRGYVIRDSEGRALRMIGAMLDITARKRAEEALRVSRERLDLVVQSTELGLWYCDLPFDKLTWNAKCKEHFGLPPDADVTIGLFFDRLHPEDRERTRESIQRSIEQQSTYDVKYRTVGLDGRVRWIRAIGRAFHDEGGKPIRFDGVTVDDTRQKQTEEELRQAKEAAEAANRAKDDFLANVSHEIRTPMNAILGLTDLVLDAPLGEDQRQSLKTVKSAADNLLGIINDLLDFSKIEAGKLELDTGGFSLRAALGDTLRALAMRAHRRGLELVCDVQPDVPDALIGDAGRLRQVLLNLVGNGIKFTDRGEVVVQVDGVAADPVAAESAPDGDVTLRFTVRDTGIGIPPEKQSTIFRAFEQEDTSTTRKYGGTGLGLTISSQLVALMGGSITVESELGRGSTFSFTARFGRQAHQPVPAATTPPVLLHNLRVLVVDDNAANRELVEQWLRDWQMEPTAVGDGMAAMDVLWHGVAVGKPHALLLLDARMPDTDGLTLAAKIRERAELSGSRIILLTSGDRPGDLARFRELRVDAHLLKPVQRDELLETIYSIMSRTSANQPARLPSVASTDSPQVACPIAAPLRILVAEDSEFNAQLMVKLFAKRNHEVRLVGNGREALALASHADFDVLLLDVHMPELDGFQVIRSIREREQTTGSHLPVIALTARSRKEDRERCLAAGMDDFLAKPIRVDDLWATIDRVVGAFPSTDRMNVNLLTPRVLLAACGGDADILRSICEGLRTNLPVHLAAIRDALANDDAPRLRESAHRLCGMVAAFSTVVGTVASDLEDVAARNDLKSARPLVELLGTMTQELIGAVDGLSLDTLRAASEPTPN